MPSVPLFVYGTLMRCHQRHDLLAGCPFLGPATTAEPMILFDCGGYPAMVRGTASGFVGGEVFSIPPGLLADLDDYEAVAEGEYVRATVEVRLASGSPALIAALAYLYARPTDGLPVVGARWPREAERDLDRPFSAPDPAKRV